MKTLIIVPAYNESATLPTLIPKIQAYGWDTLVINDCSTDNTEELLLNMDTAHLNLVNNVGLAGVTQMGFMYAAKHGYDAAMVVDGDGQHPPVYIKSLIDKIEEGYDYVIGSRYLTEKKPVTMRMIGSRLLCSAIYQKTHVKVTDPTSGMRAMGHDLLAEFAENMNFIAEPDALTYVIRHGYRFTEIPVQMEERKSGTSYFHNPLKSAGFMFRNLMSILFLQW
ncbi:MAG: glycosyltransferase family 2 protein [Bulleidia sp.]|nr:glycosyltransferase family 2 protein [Bulleidia sp.]